MRYVLSAPDSSSLWRNSGTVRHARKYLAMSRKRYTTRTADESHFVANNLQRFLSIISASGNLFNLENWYFWLKFSRCNPSYASEDCFQRHNVSLSPLASCFNFSRHTLFIYSFNLCLLWSCPDKTVYECRSWITQ